MYFIKKISQNKFHKLTLINIMLLNNMIIILTQHQGEYNFLNSYAFRHYIYMI